jgi:hypothetical protein
LFNDLRGRLRDPFLTTYESGIGGHANEKVKHSLIELLLIGIHCAAMTSKRYFPKSYDSRIAGTNRWTGSCCTEHQRSYAAKTR